MQLVVTAVSIDEMPCSLRTARILTGAGVLLCSIISSAHTAAAGDEPSPVAVVDLDDGSIYAIVSGSHATTFVDASHVAARFGGALADITFTNSTALSAALGDDSPAWVRSWLGDDYQGACIALNTSGAISIPPGTCHDAHSFIIQVPACLVTDADTYFDAIDDPDAVVEMGECPSSPTPTRTRTLGGQVPTATPTATPLLTATPTPTPRADDDGCAVTGATQSGATAWPLAFIALLAAWRRRR